MSDVERPRPDFRLVPIELIDPPPNAMREEMDDEALVALATNIKRNGVLQPPGVIATPDGRFRISWGHRRLEAAKLAGETMLPVRVVDDATKEEELKVAENYHQEPVNPVAEATYFADLLERKYGGYIEQLAAAVNRPVSTIEDRLDLLRGWPDVIDALRAKKIGLGVARELNRMKHEGWMKYRLGDAIDQGASARVVRDWRIQDEKTLAVQAASANGSIPAIPPSTEASYGSVDTCILCWLAEDQNEMDYVKVHRDCLKQLMRRVRAERRDAEASAPS